MPSNVCAFSTFTPTAPAMEKIVAKVPTMGDSISEGTIVEWAVPVGHAVKEGDVVALVETDKVTVDIKAEIDGVITAQHASVDDNVEVGSDLYEIDTEAAAVSASPTTTTTTSSSLQTDQPVAGSAANDDDDDVSVSEISASESEKAAATETTTSGVRIPSIQFLGKDGWLKRRSGTDDDIETTTEMKPPPVARPQDAITLDDFVIGAMYGRKSFTEREIEALMLGGASETPSVKSGSTGAVFRN